MRVLVLADMEGIHGIERAKTGEKLNELMTAEVLFVVEVLRNIGVCDITVCDAHDKGENIYREKFIEKNVEIVSQVWNVNFARRYDAALIVGIHGMAGSESIFAHTLREDIAKVEANGEVIGEMGIFIRWLREHNIPTIFVSGDEQAVVEALMEDAACTTLAVKRREDMFAEGILWRQEYRKKIRCAFESYKFSPLNEGAACKKDLRLYLKNQDALALVRAQARVKEKYIWSESYGELIELMVDVCEDLNLARDKILRENKEFIMEIRHKYQHVRIQGSKDSKLHQLLSKDIYTLECRDRLYIMETLQSLIKK